MNVFRLAIVLYLSVFLLQSSDAQAQLPKRIIVAYFESWAQYRPCGRFTPETLRPIINSIDIINYAFARLNNAGELGILDGQDCAIGKWTGCTAESDSTATMSRILQLKTVNPSLKVLISIGGWSWQGQNTCPTFSAMASTPTSRQTFIEQSIKFSRTMGFDGIDIDWEYPAASWRGCSASDTENFRLLLKEFRAAIENEFNVRPAGSGVQKLLLTIASPSPSNTAGLGLANIHPYLDLINLMTYDFAGGDWSSTTGHNSPLYNPSSPSNSVSGTVQHYLSAGVPSSKLVLGLPFYGRTFLVAPNAGCTVGVTSLGNGPAQSCTNEAGLIAYFEVRNLLASGGFISQIDMASGGNVFACNAAQNMWISYDNEQTLQTKTNYAMTNGLAGAMIWAVDQDDALAGFPLVTAIRQTLNGGAPLSSSSSSSTGSPDPPSTCTETISLKQEQGTNTWWVAISVWKSSRAILQVKLADSKCAEGEWFDMSRSSWGPWILAPSRELFAPLSIMLVGDNLATLTFSKVFGKIAPDLSVNTGICFDTQQPPVPPPQPPLPPTPAPVFNYINVSLSRCTDRFYLNVSIQASVELKQVMVKDAKTTQWQPMVLKKGWGSFVFEPLPDAQIIPPVSLALTSVRDEQVVLPDVIKEIKEQRIMTDKYFNDTPQQSGGQPDASSSATKATSSLILMFSTALFMWFMNAV